MPGLGKMVDQLKRIAKRILKPFIPSRVLTALTWNRANTAGEPAYWGNFPAIRHVYLERITGKPELSWYTDQVRKRPTPFGRTLCFGDGHSMAAEAALTRQDTTEVWYFNISPGECRRFEKLMRDHSFTFPFRYIQGDANNYEFSRLGMFDTIISVGSFHHFENFETIFPQLNRILSGNGILYADEYIGPDKWKYDSSVIQKINEWLACLPPELVENRTPVDGGDFFDLWKNGTDPSECIRSSELDNWLRKCFRVIDTQSFGGTWLMPFFLTAYLHPPRLNIPNWHHTEMAHDILFEMAKEESEAIESGKLPPHYLYYMMGRR